MVVRDRRRRGEIAPVEFYCSLEEGVPERVAPAVFGFPQRKEFPREQTFWCLLWPYLKYAEHLRKPVFFLRRYSIHADHHVGVTALREILLLEEIQGYSAPRRTFFNLSNRIYWPISLNKFC
jgi:hypothetical protein